MTLVHRRSDFRCQLVVGLVGTAGLIVACVLLVWQPFRLPASGANVSKQDLGSQRCQECHAEIYESYQSVAMARSFYRPTSQNVIEDYEIRNQFYHAPSDRHYRMIQRDGRFYQRRYQLDDVGRKKNICLLYTSDAADE